MLRAAIDGNHHLVFVLDGLAAMTASTCVQLQADCRGEIRNVG